MGSLRLGVPGTLNGARVRLPNDGKSKIEQLAAAGTGPQHRLQPSTQTMSALGNKSYKL
jgi:hypothetical protein